MKPLFPNSIGMHALHHIYPQIPYHNLKKAHKLCAERSEEYRDTIDTFSSAIYKLHRSMLSNSKIVEELVPEETIETKEAA